MNKNVDLSVDKNLKKFFQIKHFENGLMWEDDQETIPLGFWLLSPASNEYKQAERKIYNASVFDQKRGNDDSYDKKEARKCKLYAAVTLPGNFMYKGQLLNAENAEEFYADRNYLYIIEDVSKVLADMKSFLQPW
jgi:hypothetical protein